MCMQRVGIGLPTNVKETWALFTTVACPVCVHLHQLAAMLAKQHNATLQPAV